MKAERGFTLVELMIVVAIIGILSALAIPDFLKMQARAKQAEVKMNLGAIYSAQISYFSENNTYAGGSDAFDKLGWEPRSTYVTRYAYIMDEDVIMPVNRPPASLPSGISPTQQTFTALAAGNIDNDPFIDEWSIDNSKTLKLIQSDIQND